LAGDGLPQFASSGFDLGKGGILSSDLLGSQIDAKFFCELLDSLLIFVGPRILEHEFILELTICSPYFQSYQAFATGGRTWNSVAAVSPTQPEIAIIAARPTGSVTV
jgi:hypothetical protein